MLITGIFRNENVDVKWQPASCLATIDMGSRKTVILPTYMNGLIGFWLCSDCRISNYVGAKSLHCLTTNYGWTVKMTPLIICTKDLVEHIQAFCLTNKTELGILNVHDKDAKKACLSYPHCDIHPADILNICPNSFNPKSKEYSEQFRTTLCPLNSILLTSSYHQQAWHWLHEVSTLWPSLMVNAQYSL